MHVRLMPIQKAIYVVITILVMGWAPVLNVWMMLDQAKIQDAMMRHRFVTLKRSTVQGA